MATKKTTKPKAAAVEMPVEELEAPAVVVTVDPVEESEPVVELAPAEPEIFVLLELHEREDGWWGARVTYPGGDELSFHAPRRQGAEGAAYRAIQQRAPELPLVIKVV